MLRRAARAEPLLFQSNRWECDAKGLLWVAVEKNDAPADGSFLLMAGYDYPASELPENVDRVFIDIEWNGMLA